MFVPYKKCSPTLASKVSAVRHRWRIPSYKTPDLLLVVRKSSSLQQPSWAPATGSVGPIPDHGERWAGDHSQRRKSFHPLERPWNKHLRFNLEPPEADIAAAIPISRVSTVQPQQVWLIPMFAYEKISQSQCQTDLHHLVFFIRL